MSIFLSIVGSSLRNVPDLEPTVGCFCVSPLWHFFIILSSGLLLTLFLPVSIDLLILLAALNLGEDFLLGLSELCEFCVSFFSFFVLESTLACVTCRVLKGAIVFTDLQAMSGVFAASSKFLRKLCEL